MVRMQVMDAAGTEPTLRDLKAPALAQQNIAGGTRTFSRQTLAHGRRRIVEAENPAASFSTVGCPWRRAAPGLRLLLMPRR